MMILYILTHTQITLSVNSVAYVFEYSGHHAPQFASLSLANAFCSKKAVELGIIRAAAPTPGHSEEVVGDEGEKLKREEGESSIYGDSLIEQREADNQRRISREDEQNRYLAIEEQLCVEPLRIAILEKILAHIAERLGGIGSD